MAPPQIQIAGVHDRDAPRPAAQGSCKMPIGDSATVDDDDDDYDDKKEQQQEDDHTSDDDDCGGSSDDDELTRKAKRGSKRGKERPDSERDLLEQKKPRKPISTTIEEGQELRGTTSALVADDPHDGANLWDEHGQHWHTMPPGSPSQRQGGIHWNGMYSPGMYDAFI